MKQFCILSLLLGFMNPLISGTGNTKLKLQLVRKILLQTEQKDILNITSFQYTGDRIFAADLAYGRQIFMFDKDGVLLKEIGRTGQGPGEYAFAGSVYYSRGVIHVGAGNKQHNLYDEEGKFLKKISVPTIKEPAIYCRGKEDGSVFATSFSHYSPFSIYHLSKDGEVTKQFSPADEDYGKVFDNYYPYGGMIRSDDRLIQFFNHRYQLIFWDLDGNLIKKVQLRSKRYVEPDYDVEVMGYQKEVKFRQTFTLFAGFQSLGHGFVSLLMTSHSKHDYSTVLDIWDKDFQLLGFAPSPPDEEFLGVVEKDKLVFFIADDDKSYLVLRKVSK